MPVKVRFYPYTFLIAILAVLVIFVPAARAQEYGFDAVEADVNAPAEGRTQFILGVSWQPGFCETRPKRPECTSQTAERPDASRFSLHGLWMMRKTYCGIPGNVTEADKKGDWKKLPEIALSDEARARLAVLMPGMQSGLERHEWIKHGTCFGITAEDYFRTAMALVDTLNASPVRALFAGHLGKSLKEADIKQAFATAFGPAAGDRVRMRCAKDGDRRVITGLTIGLSGDLSGDPAGGDSGGGDPALAGLMLAAGPTTFGCPEGIADAAGNQ